MVNSIKKFEEYTQDPLMGNLSKIQEDKTLLLLEFNKKDKWLVQDNQDLFTIAVEIELETDDTEESSYAGEDTDVDADKFRDISKTNAKEFLKQQNRMDIEFLIEEILGELSFKDYSDETYNLDIFQEYKERYNNEEMMEYKLIELLESIFLAYHYRYWASGNINYLRVKFKKYFSNFQAKWGKLIKFELDESLQRGIEFSPKSYLENIDKTVEFISDFYEEYDKQNYWKMRERTGIHINIGLKNPKEWNILKGLIMISDETKESYVFKGMVERFQSFYSKSLKILFKEILQKNKSLLSKDELENLKDFEGKASKLVLQKLSKGYKNYGFNITKLKEKNYIEFRYPGGDISKDVLINKIYYFGYIVYLMTTTYKHKDYLKKLYKFISY